MELTRFRPYDFAQPSEVVSLYVSVCMRHINRFDWNEHQYLGRNIPLSWRGLRKLLLKTAYNWTLIFLLICVVLLPISTSTNSSSRPTSHLAAFSRLFERTLHIAKIDLFLSSYLMTFAICEYTCFISAWMALHYEDTRWNVCYELRATVDRKLSPPTKEKLLAYFRRNSTLAGVVNKVGLGWWW